jgi:hypothetical protein
MVRGGYPGLASGHGDDDLRAAEQAQQDRAQSHRPDRKRGHEVARARDHGRHRLEVQASLGVEDDVALPLPPGEVVVVLVDDVDGPEGEGSLGVGALAAGERGGVAEIGRAHV